MLKLVSSNHSPLEKFNTIGEDEISAVSATMRAGPLSGYLGGRRNGGLKVEMLEHEFSGALGVRHAVAVNSATSGLLVACIAAGVHAGDTVVTSPFTMSATAAAPGLLGANILFGDIEADTFCLNELPAGYQDAKAVITVNLFGHPAKLAETRKWAGASQTILIEDNAQAPFAKEGKHFTGTIGDIGVFSFNVHKHLQCGEGGICVTDDDELAYNMRMARNHGEMSDNPVGLNLRMTEVTAAIALAQLKKRSRIIAERIEIAEALTAMAMGIPGLEPPIVRKDCKHVYYSWAMKVKNRETFMETMRDNGIPMKAGYVPPLYRLPAFAAFARECPNAERMHDRELVTYENCAWTPSAKQLKMFGETFKIAAEP